MDDPSKTPEESKRRTGWDRRERDDRRHLHRRGTDEPVSEERRAGRDRRKDAGRRGRETRRSGRERRDIPDRRSSAWKALNGELDG